jgi:hypothetical protein
LAAALALAALTAVPPPPAAAAVAEVIAKVAVMVVMANATMIKGDATPKVRMKTGGGGSTSLVQFTESSLQFVSVSQTLPGSCYAAYAGVLIRTGTARRAMAAVEIEIKIEIRVGVEIP